MKFYLLANGENGDELIIVEEANLIDFGVAKEMSIHLEEVFVFNNRRAGNFYPCFTTKDGETFKTVHTPTKSENGICGGYFTVVSK